MDSRKLITALFTVLVVSACGGGDDSASQNPAKGTFTKETDEGGQSSPIQKYDENGDPAYKSIIK